MTHSTLGRPLLPCPFCGGQETVLEPDSKHWTGMRYNILSYRVMHWCEERDSVRGSRIEMRAKTENEAIEKWNKRS